MMAIISLNKRIIKELVLSFTAGVLGATVWYYLGIHIYPDLHEINLSGFEGYINLLTHYALPIQIVATIFFYIELYVHSLSMKMYYNNSRQ